MDYEKFITIVRKTMQLGTKENNPMYFAEAKGMLKTAITLLHPSIFTATEKLEMLQLYNECSLLLIKFVKECV